MYTIEELLAMIFSHAKNQAEVYAEQKIKVGWNIFDSWLIQILFFFPSMYI